MTEVHQVSPLDWRTDIEICKRSILIDLLSQCTYDQIQNFNKVFGSCTELSGNKLERALDACERTINKREAKEGALTVI